MREGAINYFLYYNYDRHLGETRGNKDDTSERRGSEPTSRL
nr:MAG TPA: hypothetical protein [Caudoviricetes sp.]